MINRVNEQVRTPRGTDLDGGLYPAEAAWAGVCDRMADVSPLAANRREVLRFFCCGTKNRCVIVGASTPIHSWARYRQPSFKDTNNDTVIP